MKEIKDIVLRVLPNAAHFSYHSAFLKALEADSKVTASITEPLETYKTALKKEEDSLIVSQKSFKTDEITKADKDRDGLYKGLKKAVESFAHLPGMQTQEAYKVLNQVIKDYGIKTTMQIDQQTALMVKFIEDLEQKYTKQVQILDLGKFLSPLKVANEKVRENLSGRTEERSTKEAGAMKSARIGVDETYRLLVKHINAYALVGTPSDYEAFIDWANEHISRFKKQVIKGK